MGEDIKEVENEIGLNEEKKELKEFLKDKLGVLLKLKDKEEKSSEIGWDNKKMKFTINIDTDIPYIVLMYSIFNNITDNFKKCIYPVFYLYEDKIILSFGKNTDSSYNGIKLVWDKRIDNISMKIMKCFSTESGEKSNIIKNTNVYSIYKIKNKDFNEELLDSIVDSFIEILEYYLFYIDMYNKYNKEITDDKTDKKDLKEILEDYLKSGISSDEQRECEEDKKNYDEKFYEFSKTIQKLDVDFYFPLNKILYGTSKIESIYNLILYSVAIIERNQEIYKNAYNFENYISFLERFKGYIGNEQIKFIASNDLYTHEKFKEFCDEVEKDEYNNNYILILDNIDRSDVLKIFGDDYSELEKRVCNKRDSKLPKNLYILGTMETFFNYNTLLNIKNIELYQYFSFTEMYSKDKFIKNIGEIDEEIKGIFKINKKDFKFPLNAILYGPPGTGKTYNSILYSLGIATEKEVIISGIKNNTETISDKEINEFNILKEKGQVEFITFHQSYSYEDFVEGIRPTLATKDNEIKEDNKDLKYTIHSGIFKNICKRAIDNPDKNYVLIIDEINRGNISKIFGELITLLEPTKRLGEAEELKIRLPYSGKEFGIPKNLYILGTMNTADRSIALLDIALRRRFNFIEMPPKYNILKTIDCEEGVINLQNLLEAINTRIEFLLDKDHLIGHSYLVNVKSFDDLKEVFRSSIIPLLQEYFYDDFEKIRVVLNIGDNYNDKESFIIKKEIPQNFSETLKKKLGKKSVYIINEAEIKAEGKEIGFNKYQNYTKIYN